MLDRYLDPKKRETQTTEERFFERLEDALLLVETYLSVYRQNPTPNALSDVYRSKEKFYDHFAVLEIEMHLPQGNFTEKSRDYLHLFRNFDWTLEDHLKTVESYIFSLKSEFCD